MSVWAGLTVLSGPARAADAEAPSSPRTAQLEELIVTAQRREESSQKVAISMTVLSAEQVAQHLRVSSDVDKLVPNVMLEATNGFGTPRTSIRGVSQGDFNPNATTSNTIYLDDVPMDIPISQGVPLWDLSRVEVLRGPQGTLFGRNATGGAIRFISARPTDQLEGYIDLTYGAHDQRQVRAAVSVPISDTLRTRFSYVGYDFGGDVNNITTHTKIGKQNYQGFRGILEWKPTEQLRVALEAQTFDSHTDNLYWKTTPGLSTVKGLCTPSCVHGFNIVADIQKVAGFQNLGPPSNYYTKESDLPGGGFETLKSTPISLNVDYDLGFATLTSVTGFLQAYQTIGADFDTSPMPIYSHYVRTFARQWSQEVRLTSNGQGPFKWIAGAFYMKQFVKYDGDYMTTGWYTNTTAPPSFPNAGSTMYSRGVRNELETWAPFLHTTYQITPDLMLTAAVRYTEENKDAQYRFRTIWQFPSTGKGTTQEYLDFLKAVDSGNRGILLNQANPASATRSKGFSGVTWKVGLDYQLNDQTLLYGFVSRGFKGGAFQPIGNTLASIAGPDGQVVAVQPETVTDYEIGTKSDLIPGRLRVNAGLFYYDYKNYQTNQFISALQAQILSNLAKAELYGAELEVTAVPVENLTLSVNMGAVHSEVKKAADPTLVGHKMPFAQDFNWNVMARYDVHTDWGVFSPEIDLKHTGNYYQTKENNPLQYFGNYTLIDAQIGFESPNRKYYGSIWGRNLEDKMVPITADDPAEFWGSNIAHLNDHRKYGVTVGVRF